MEMSSRRPTWQPCLFLLVRRWACSLFGSFTGFACFLSLPIAFTLKEDKAVVVDRNGIKDTEMNQGTLVAQNGLFLRYYLCFNTKYFNKCHKIIYYFCNIVLCKVHEKKQEEDSMPTSSPYPAYPYRRTYNVKGMPKGASQTDNRLTIV